MKNRLRQPDLFDTFRQDDLFDQRRLPETPSPDYVRERMHKILDEARAASTLPWDTNTARVYENIFPQMSKWLPSDEAEELKAEFDEEMRRLKAA